MALLCFLRGREGERDRGREGQRERGTEGERESQEGHRGREREREKRGSPEAGLKLTQCGT